MNINVVIQWKVVGGADVLNSCAQSFFEDPRLKCPKCFHCLWGFVFGESLKKCNIKLSKKLHQLLLRLFSIVTSAILCLEADKCTEVAVHLEDIFQQS